MNVEPTPKLSNEENKIPPGSFVLSTENQLNIILSKQVMNHILMCYDESKTHFYPSSTSMSAFEHISLRVSSIILK